MSLSSPVADTATPSAPQGEQFAGVTADAPWLMTATGSPEVPSETGGPSASWSDALNEGEPVFSSAPDTALRYARGGMRWAGATLRTIARGASWFDAWTYGQRGRIVVALAAALVVGQIITLVIGKPTLELLVGVIFLCVLGAYGLARVQDFRDDSGRFTLRVIIGNLWALVRFVTTRDEGQEDGSGSPEHKWARRLFMAGGGILALRSLLSVPSGVWSWVTGASTPALDNLLSWLLLAWLPLGYGGYVLMGGLWRRFLRGGGSSDELSLESPANAVTSSADLRRLPAALDLVGTKARDRDAANAIEDPVLRKIVEALPHWRPKRSRYEAEYQAALGRFLRRRLRGHAVAEQFPLKDFDQNAHLRRRRVDIVVDETIAIEIKPRISRSADIHRTIGQVREYSEMWGGRGPVLLLVCETPSDFESTFAVRQLAIRDGEMSATTMVVAAGIRT